MAGGQIRNNMSEQFEKIGEGLLVRAPGKINISLLVKGKRADGYHDIESIMAKIDWFDEILIEPGQQDGIELICKGPYKVPEGEENLVWKAAQVILGAVEQLNSGAEKQRIRITLTKNMPAGSGLGSGSSDAAATLLGINKFLKLGLSKKELNELAAKLGSDVAFFLNGTMAICTGRGEKVKKIQESEFRVLLFVPNVSSSTKRVYENYRHDEAKFDTLREEINLYIAKKRIDFICSIGANMLQVSCFELYKELVELKKRIESLGIRPVALSGSGSTMFCIINGMNQEGAKRNQEGAENREKLEKETGCRIISANNNSW
jgi:4-diphosphocytidyl-2-C-methyl-D-erythritol kinase